MILKLQSSCAINERAINRRAINDYMERFHPMMQYGSFIEVYNNMQFMIPKVDDVNY